MNKSTKALLYNFLAFAVFYFSAKFLMKSFTGLEGIKVSFLALGISMVLAPKFHATHTNEGEKIFMKWIFLKGLKEIK